MGFGQSGWFTALLEQELGRHQPLVDARAPGVSPRAKARAHVRMVLQDSGLLYGTPEQVEHRPPTPRTVRFHGDGACEHHLLQRAVGNQA